MTSTQPAPAPQTVHASAVALGGKAVLITGASGQGKSALALELMALGAALVSDDRVILTRAGGRLIASAPGSIAGQIEARFVGLLKAEHAGPTPLALLVQLDNVETDRLPPLRSTELMGVMLPTVHKCEGRSFAAAILQYLKGGRIA